MEKRFFALVINFIFVTLIISQLMFGQSDVIVPLAVGNYWEYIDSTFYNDTLFVVNTSKLGITGEINIEYQGNNYDVFYWNWFNTNTNPPQPESNKWLIRNEADGLWEYGMLNDTDTLLLQNLSLKFPANIGDSWLIMAYTITDTSIIVRDTLIMECLNTDKEYITPSGIFQCYVYQYQLGILKSPVANYILPFEETEIVHNSQNAESDTSSVLLYFAPNVGFVGMDANLGYYNTKSYLSSYYLITNVKNSVNELSDFQLYQNYPNPFNPSTKIKFSLPVTLSGVEGSPVTLKVYNVLGKEVAVLLNKEFTAGAYEVEWDATGLPSGVYFYQLKSNSFVETKKMILMK